MQRIVLDAGSWRSEDDLWDALLEALGAPGWHGRNLDALWDSLTDLGDTPINRVRPPFEIHVVNAANVPPAVAARLADIAILFAEAEEEGAEIALHLVRAL